MPSPTDMPSYTRPIYTREALLSLEAALTTDAEHIELVNYAGNTIQVRNPFMRTKNQKKKMKSSGSGSGSGSSNNDLIWTAEQEERNQRKRHRIMIIHERELEPQGGPDEFFPISNTLSFPPPANRSEEQTRATLEKVLRGIEDSGEASAIADFIRKQLILKSNDDGSNVTVIRPVDKIIAFGLGALGHMDGDPEDPQMWFLKPLLLKPFYDHAMAIVVARAVAALTRIPITTTTPLTAPKRLPMITLLVQDGMYTDVCIRVLADFGVEVIGGHGGLGFALVDEKTIVLSRHNIGVPLAAVIADIARPVMISMAPERTEMLRIYNSQMMSAVKGIRKIEGVCHLRTGRRRSWGMLELLEGRDNGSRRSRDMIGNDYTAYSMPMVDQKAFWENAWYVRNWDPDTEAGSVAEGTGSV